MQLIISAVTLTHPRRSSAHCFSQVPACVLRWQSAPRTRQVWAIAVSYLICLDHGNRYVNTNCNYKIDCHLLFSLRRRLAIARTGPTSSGQTIRLAISAHLVQSSLFTCSISQLTHFTAFYRDGSELGMVCQNIYSVTPSFYTWSVRFGAQWGLRCDLGRLGWISFYIKSGSAVDAIKAPQIILWNRQTESL